MTNLRPTRRIALATPIALVAAGAVVMAVPAREGTSAPGRAPIHAAGALHRPHPPRRAPARPSSVQSPPAHAPGPVPILMYHMIARPGPGAAMPGLYVPPAVFSAQMRWLDRHGYHVVALHKVYDGWHGGRLPRRPIVVSFDDGYLNQYLNAAPILARHGWAGTLNLAVDHIGARPGTGTGLTARMVQRMIDEGWEVDSHTLTHADLTALDGRTLWHEVSASRSALRRLFHVPASFLCYPYGAYDARVIAAARRARYLGATSTEDGLAAPHDLWSLDRVRVVYGEGVSGLAHHLRALRG